MEKEGKMIRDDMRSIGVRNKKGQVAIYIIIAILIAGAIIAYFLFRGEISGVDSVPAEFKPIYDYYAVCVEEETRGALDIAGSQGGRLYVPEYIPGSDFAPFSSQLNFLGFPVPYWYYIAGNGIIREEVPTKSEIEQEIGEYLTERIGECDYTTFYEQGFDIERKAGDVRVKIEEARVIVEVSDDLTVKKDERSARKNRVEVNVESKFGKFYNLAREIYQKEKQDAFLENYTVDVLRLYAHVDGVEISCSPQIWQTRNVVDDIQTGLEGNLGALKVKGDYYTKDEKSDDYYIIDVTTDERVNFVYSKNWPYKIEIDGDGVDQELMVAEPVGNQEGLGIMGFCYNAYHYVYDLSFPVLIQVYNDEEIFQFPVAVVIDNNKPREAIYSEINDVTGELDLCQFRTNEIEVNLYDINLNPINGNVSYICFNQQCRLGESENGKLITTAPACVNGYIQVRAEGYAEKKQLFSSNEEDTVEVILDREHELEVELQVDGKKSSERAIISFARENGKTTTLALPENGKIKLSEGAYEARVFVYGNSSITIPASTKTECREVTRGGIAGFFGSKKEECFDIQVPETKVEYALTGGGKSIVYLLPSDLEKNKIIVRVSGLQRPDSLEKLQYNFAIFDSQKVDLEFI